MRPPECVWDLRAELGEGPCWLARERMLWFVDIAAKRIHRFDPAAGTGQTWTVAHKPSFILPEEGGRWLVGIPGGIACFSPADGSLAVVRRVERNRPHNRLNDACIDRHGRLWFGTMDDLEREPSGALYCWRGRSAPVVRDRGYVVSNGPAFSPDGRVLYHTDSTRGIVFRFDVDAEGRTRGKRALIELEPGAGSPDGTTVDAEGFLWIALWGGWALRRYAPDGRLVGVVPMPCANVTKLAFGGDDLRTAYVTTARAGLDAPALAAQSLAGGLFAFEADVPGLPQPMARFEADQAGEGG